MLTIESTDTVLVNPFLYITPRSQRGNYIYNLVRFPLGIIYEIKTTSKSVYKIGAEIILNYSFQKIYNGGKPFPNANNKISDFQYSGNSVIVFTSIGIQITSYSLLELEPYLRIYHTHKKDQILFEDPKESIKNSFDALGVIIKYPLTIQYRKQQLKTMRLKHFCRTLS